MLRLLRYFVLLGLLAAAAVWIAARPGEIAVDWLGWRIETSVTVLAAILLAAGFLFSILLGIWRFVWGAPRNFFRARREKKLKKGYAALTKGLVAVAAGDAKEAQRLARKAEEMKIDPPLTLLLSAQAAQLSGDAVAAKRFFQAMAENSETSFLGLRGLLTQAMKDGNADEALDLARRAHRALPKADWPAQALFDLAIKEKNWTEAQSVVEDMARAKLLDDSAAKRRKAVLLLARAQAGGPPEEAHRLARQAHDLARDLAPAALFLAAALVKEGKDKKAASAIETAWSVRPHPDLGRAYLALWPEEDALHRVRHADRLANFKPGHSESRLLAAEAALEARLWGQAKATLAPLLENGATQRVFRLYAAIEASEASDPAKGHECAYPWLIKAADAAPDPTWHCRACGHRAGKWEPVCPACGGFDTAEWGEGAKAVPALASPAADMPSAERVAAPPQP